MQRRRFLGLTAAGAATAALAPALTACGSDGGSGSKTLRVVAADYGDKAANSSQKYWDALARAFEEKNKGVKVEATVLSWTEVDKKVAEMVAAGKAPDVAQIGAYADFAAAGKLYSADQLLTIPTQADIIASIARAGEVGRVQYGLPFVSSTRMLFYNKTLFAKAGIAKAPESWDELQAAAKKLQSAGVKIPYGLPLGPEEAPAETLLWMLSGGSGYTDHDGTYTINSDENIATFTWLRDELVGKGLAGSGDPSRTNRQDVFDAFCNGQVGMLNGHPTLMKQAEAKGIKYGLAPLPGKSGKAKATMGVADWIMAFKAGGHREEAGRFLDFVYSTKNVLTFTGQYDLLPVTTSASEKMRSDNSKEHLKPFLEQIDNAVFYPVDKTSWAKVSKALKEKIGSVVLKGGDPASVLGEIKREADAMELAGTAK
ncbi:ABC transporter substrate-binding protein [Streptomyces sp. URMC 127]|uniref:ABC transporter substrate-binding protein n=1 Tax=Streptomyces sp. URMC 127 TaxID=3423402 RepID=UPI003F1C15F4